MKASLPGNEADRLRAVQLTGLLDTPPEDEFDSLVRLASVVCKTPMALVTLVDDQRQWFKAKVGLDATETHRDIAFCAHTILGSEIFLVEDAWEDPRFAENPLVTGELGIRFYAGVPLSAADGLRVGTLCVIDQTPRILPSEQREALLLLAIQANKQINLCREQKALRDTLSITSAVEQELRKSESLFHAFMDHAPFVAFMKDTEGRFVYYNQHLADRFSISRDAWIGKTDAELWPIELAERVRTNDLTVLREWRTLVTDERANPTEAVPTLWRSYKFPFRDMVGTEYVAGFAVNMTAEREAQQQIQTYQAALIAANEKLQSMATTDELTKLCNRRAFENALDREVAMWARTHLPLSLLIIDIDDFKSFNDSFGHEEGDRVLRHVAEAMQRCFRSTDVVARYGGEEFAVLLPNTSKLAAAESAERLRLAVGNVEIGPRRISISVGLATLHNTFLTKSEFLRSADDALYEAKRQGKDRVCTGV
jgi:diguanylate cyclase (GGDEF)-like protein/PAS domain S-box-containing protein